MSFFTRRSASLLMVAASLLLVGCGKSRPQSSNPDFPDTTDPAAATEMLYGDMQNARNSN